MILTISRILRCNPYNPGGYDPVPETGLRYKGSRVIPISDDGCQHKGDPCRKDDGTGPRQEAEGEHTASCKEDGE